MNSLGLPKGYDAWRTMSEDDYYEAMERSWWRKDEPENPYENEND